MRDLKNSNFLSSQIKTYGPIPTGKSSGNQSNFDAVFRTGMSPDFPGDFRPTSWSFRWGTLGSHRKHSGRNTAFMFQTIPAASGVILFETGRNCPKKCHFQQVPVGSEHRNRWSGIYNPDKNFHRSWFRFQNSEFFGNLSIFFVHNTILNWHRVQIGTGTEKSDFADP